MNMKTWIISAALATTLVLVMQYTPATAMGMKECQHYTNGVMDGTYAIVPTSQQCPQVPSDWRPPSSSNDNKNTGSTGDGSLENNAHDPLDHSCTIGSSPIDL